ncbi:ferredoxin [Streptomyces paludis]|uniref:Ferredoxin n=1 Tax=Streptomyces paludis TaxID=2282738 RepID=A0A345HZ19_9ACTN|nr:ferredoxin [Streptomyces paludis]AXG81943.1 ferredoxin [Streptomyces paludis]
MRVKVDVPRCVSSGQCAMIAPEVFDQDEKDGTVVVLDRHPPAATHDTVRESAAVCPGRAIRLDEPP